MPALTMKPMELECPQCAKRLTVSPEELALHAGAVVCPQCLTVFDASGDVPEGTILERPVRVVEEHLTYGYCPHCGRKIPQGVNFCPYCGQSLADVGEDADTGDSAGNDGNPEPVADEQTSSATSSGSHHGHSSGEHRSSHRHSSRRQWQPVMPSYRYAQTSLGWRSGAQKASTLFAFVSWVVIAALIVLLAFIIHKVNLIT